MTDNIWSYKPPCTKTIPLDFRVRLYPVDETRNALEDTGGEARRQVVEDHRRAGHDAGNHRVFRDQTRRSWTPAAN